MTACCRPSRRGRLALAALIFVGTSAGCSQNIFKTGLVRPGTSPPPGLAPPAVEGLPNIGGYPAAAPPVVSMDGVPPILPPTSAAPFPASGAGPPDPSLSRSREQASLLEDEVRALRDQLASTSSQLAVERQRATGVFPPPNGAIDGSSAAPGLERQLASKPATAPVTMQSLVGQLRLPDGQARIDGGVIRVEIPSDKIFEAATAALLPGGAAVLTQVASEVTRVFPGHFIGIEGHLDSEPLPAGSQLPPHQLTAARAAAVFDFLTSRTSILSRQLFLVAHGPNHPVVSNATAAGRARNRRIELVIYPETVAPPAGM